MMLSRRIRVAWPLSFHPHAAANKGEVDEIPYFICITLNHTTVVAKCC